MDTGLYIDRLKEFIDQYKDNLHDICHMTYTSLANITKINQYKDWQLLKIVVEIALQQKILSRGFEYIDPNDDVFTLDQENIDLLLDTNGFVHPETGDIIRCPAPDVVCEYFYPCKVQ